MTVFLCKRISVMSNVFQLTNTVDPKAYLESKYGFRFKNNKVLCLFHQKKNPSFFYYSEIDSPQ